MKALYALSSKIASFDFFSWLVLAKAAGATEVVFDTRAPKVDKWPEAVVMRRFESFLLPGAALAGLPARIGTQGEDRWRTDARHLIQHVRAGGAFEPLRSVYPPSKQDVRYTVTLRNDARIPHRNSNAAAWRAFAAEIGALVIEDYDDRPIHLHARAALYAGAEMNFFVLNGPMHVCSLMGAPLMAFGANVCEGGLAKTGIAWGENYPWHGPDQQLVWEDDTLQNIRRHFAAWQERRCKLAA